MASIKDARLEVICHNRNTKYFQKNVDVHCITLCE